MGKVMELAERSAVDELEIEARHADHMASMAQYWMRRAQEAERTVGVLILAAGGSISVHDGDLRFSRQVTVSKEYYPEDMTVRFRARSQNTPDIEERG